MSDSFVTPRPLQYSSLENPKDGGAQWAAVHEVAKSQTRLSDFTLTFSLLCIGEGNGHPLQYSCLENLRDEEPGWLPSMGSQRVRHDLSDLAAAAAVTADGDCSHEIKRHSLEGKL